jgi:hypothetical protein
VLTLGAASSWGQVPATNDISDNFGNTGGGTATLVNVTPSGHGSSAGSDNTAYGDSALGSTTTGSFNTAVGSHALSNTTTGGDNTAVGPRTLLNNTTGTQNIAVGGGALESNTTGTQNIAVGGEALQFITGNNNIAIGWHAGRKLTSGNQNIYLGHKGPGDHTEARTMRLGHKQTRTFIAGIANSPLSGSPVVITNTGRLGIVMSSARYKRDIQDMAVRSQGVYQLRPVTFRYKQDSQRQRQYGLIAEEVAKVYPELVTKGADGKIESVQYHELIPMLLNELQHQQQKQEAQARQISAQSQELAELKAQNEHLRAALVQQNAALAARLEQLEQASHSATVAAR